MIRAFLAIELPQDMRSLLVTIQQDLKRHLERTVSREARIGWVRPASMHLTLRFLGQMQDESIDPLRVAIQQAVSVHQPIHLPLERLGVFPSPPQPRVLWAGPSKRWEQGPDAQRLRALHRTVENCCQASGFAPDSRPFSAHLTFARIKEGERRVGLALAQSGVMDEAVMVGTLPIEAIVLMQSELHATGAVYTRLWEATIRET